MELENSSYCPPSDKPESCECNTSNDCSEVARQYVDINASVELKPSATIGEIETECCGEPIVCCNENHCRKAYEITISQKLCIKIPIIYNVTACVGESDISCGCDCDKKDFE